MASSRKGSSPPERGKGGTDARLFALVRTLARAAAREYVANGTLDASPNPQEASDEGSSVRPVLKRQPARRVDR